jgi:proteasome lid subunit RPN8/RPN11
MLDHAGREPCCECCGLLAGSGGIITRAFPATNAAKNPATAYEIAPQELFRLMHEIRAARLELLGIYHSHPKGKNEPSPTDIARAFYPDAAYFIISPCAVSMSEGAAQPVRAFSIRDGRATELKIEVL